MRSRYYRTEPVDELPYWRARGWMLVAAVPYLSGGCSVLLWRESLIRDDARGGDE